MHSYIENSGKQILMLSTMKIQVELEEYAVIRCTCNGWPLKKCTVVFPLQFARNRTTTS